MKKGMAMHIDTAQEAAPAPAGREALSLIARALHFAAQKHSTQRRKDAAASPYINHPIALMDVLVNEGNVCDPEVLCGALLHDTIEDTETTEAELRREFGDAVTDIVLAVTDDKTLSKAERKQLQIDHAPHMSPRAKLVKLADKICNLRDIVMTPPAGWPQARKTEYFAWASRVVDGLRGTHPQLERLFDGIVDRQRTEFPFAG
jgi:guanosine-3',5'-bis(diphosphate) 3'-pyrophosphohydrolase